MCDFEPRVASLFRKAVLPLPAVSLLLTLCVLDQSMAFAQAPASQREARLEQLLKRFPDADANEDGKLTEEEARKYRIAIQEKRKSSGRKPQRPQPSHANVRYGPHERNIFDIWLPAKNAKEQSAKPPVFVYFHGGGFVAGDKAGFDPSAFLADGMAVISANYRFVDGRSTLSPAPLLDASRVIQFVRSRAEPWHLDVDKIAVCGNSAGAVISMWIGYHDDLADADSDDLIARQSSRVACVAALNGPTNLDPSWITKTMGGPKHIHGSYPKMFGAQADAWSEPEIRARILQTSPIEHVSADDPPTLLIYNGRLEGIPLPESTSTGVLIHHAYFGKALKARLDAKGVPNKFLPGTDPRQNGYDVIRAWLKQNRFDDGI